MSELQSNFRIHCVQDWRNESIGLFVSRKVRTDDDGPSIVQSLTPLAATRDGPETWQWNKADPYASGWEPPTIELTNDQAQNLVNQLWELGIRPAGAAGSSGALSATESHVNSLRAIAFKLAGVS